MTDLLIIGTSLDPDSRSQRLARIAFEDARTLNMNPELIDLRELELPMAGMEGSWDDPRVQALKTRVKQFHRVLLCVPIYNYDANAAAKNFIELVGSALEGTVVGFACTAGGCSSYMSVMAFANALQLDFRVWIAPRFVYAIDNEWNADDPGEKIRQRIHGLLESLRDGPK